MTYAIIQNGVCQNIIEADADFAADYAQSLACEAAELPERFGIGSLYQDGAWSAPEAQEGNPVTDLEVLVIDLEYRMTLMELGLI
ncbi:hypothetical protein LJC32_05910 [Oscillospiraceae bacterium OttesenSCG-928-F05]|nr:hypothetical protein [Oscillospiraceae bacterium OttesenSCG-928-F05]